MLRSAGSTSESSSSVLAPACARHPTAQAASVSAVTSPRPRGQRGVFNPALDTVAGRWPRELRRGRDRRRAGRRGVPPGALADGRAEGRARRAAPRRRRVLLLRVHAVEGAAAPRRAARRGAARAGRARGGHRASSTSPAVLRRRDEVIHDLDDRAAALARGARHRAGARRTAGSTASGACGSATTTLRARGGGRRHRLRRAVPPIHGPREAKPVDQPRGDHRAAGPGAPARARRRRRRRRAGAGLAPLGSQVTLVEAADAPDRARGAVRGRAGRGGAARARASTCAPAPRRPRSRATAARSTVDARGRRRAVAATSCWSRSAARRAPTTSGSRRVGLEPGRAARGRRRAARGRQRLALRDRRRQRARAADPHGQVPGARSPPT